MRILFIIISGLLAILFIDLIQAGTSYTVTNGVVRDHTTGLIWIRCTLQPNGAPDESTSCSAIKGRYIWTDAIDACNNLIFSGRSDWRLPNIKELQSISVHYPATVIEPPAINHSVFPNTASNHYWSSTSYISNPSSNAWTIDFSAGSATFPFKTDGLDDSNPIYVRCVAGP